MTTELRNAYLEMQKACGITRDCTVKVVRKAQTYEMGWQNSWAGDMDEYVGKSYLVEDVNENGIRFYGSHLRFPWFVLDVVDKPVAVILNKDYTAHVYPNKVVVGCQTFTMEAINRLIEAVDGMKKKPKKKS